MKIAIMRHSEAERFSTYDATRPLTARGWQQSAQMAVWLQQQPVILKEALVSPYLRTQQTFEAVQRILPHLAQLESPLDLTPQGNVLQLADYLIAMMLQGCQTLLLISHLPLVSHLVTTLCNLQTAPCFVPSTLVIIELEPISLQGHLYKMQAPEAV